MKRTFSRQKCPISAKDKEQLDSMLESLGGIDKFKELLCKSNETEVAVQLKPLVDKIDILKLPYTLHLLKNKEELTPIVFFSPALCTLNCFARKEEWAVITGLMATTQIEAAISRFNRGKTRRLAISARACTTGPFHGHKKNPCHTLVRSSPSLCSPLNFQLLSKFPYDLFVYDFILDHEADEAIYEYLDSKPRL